MGNPGQGAPAAAGGGQYPGPYINTQGTGSGFNYTPPDLYHGPGTSYQGGQFTVNRAPFGSYTYPNFDPNAAVMHDPNRWSGWAPGQGPTQMPSSWPYNVNYTGSAIDTGPSSTNTIPKYTRQGNQWVINPDYMSQWRAQAAARGTQAEPDRRAAAWNAFNAQGGGQWVNGRWVPGPSGSTSPVTQPSILTGGPTTPGVTSTAWLNQPLTDQMGNPLTPGTDAWQNQYATQQPGSRRDTGAYMDRVTQPGGELYQQAFEQTNPAISGQASMLGDPRFADWQSGPGGRALISRLSQTAPGLAFLQSRGLGNLAG